MRATGGATVTEQEWLACADPWPMLNSIAPTADQPRDRKYLLLACACCRRLWHLLADERFREAVEFAERFADGRESEEAYNVLDLRLCTLLREQFGDSYDTMTTEGFAAESVVDLLAQTPPVAADCAMRRVPYLMEREGKDRAYELANQCSLLREIFGNPFRPLTLNNSWLTPTVTSLAQGIYDERQLPSGHLDNQRMGILADALEENGCDNTDILNHCRQPGEHVRGCWVLDLLLGKN
jgi:hypothetical protein